MQELEMFFSTIIQSALNCSGSLYARAYNTQVMWNSLRYTLANDEWLWLTIAHFYSSIIFLCVIYHDDDTECAVMRNRYHFGWGKPSQAYHVLLNM